MDQKYCISCDEPVVNKIPPCPLQCMSPKCTAYHKKCVIDTEKMPVVWVMGAPGCSRYSVCEKIAKTYGFTHLSIGDLLRLEVSKGGVKAKCLTSCMDRGSLIPNDIVLGLVKDTMIRMEEENEHTMGFVLNGFPREKYQGIQFERQIGPAALILLFEASYDSIFAKLMERVNVFGRRDDTKCGVKLRLETYERYQPAITKEYKDRLVRVNAEQHPDMIFNDIRPAMDKVIARTQAILLEAEAKKAKEILEASAQRANK